MSNLRQILHTIKGGGSGLYGVTTRKKYMTECHRALYLDEQVGPRPVPHYYEVGTIGHIYNELHHTKGGFNLRDLELTVEDGVPMPSQENLVKAEIAFRNYRAHVSGDALGTVIEAEKTHTIELDGHMLATKPDLITKVNSRIAHKIRKLLNIVVEPGYWIWDYKFVGRNTFPLSYRYSIQFPVMLAVLEKTFSHPINGVMVLLIPKEGSRPPTGIKIPPLTDLDRKIVLEFCEATEAARASYLAALDSGQLPFCNHDKCFYPKTCYHYETGACLRY